jgi:AcrR family transcriptional regulator
MSRRFSLDYNHPGGYYLHMPRKRLVDDADLLAAARRELARAGPARITVEGVAIEAGLAKATVLQRFGSKRGLMIALARQSTFLLREKFAAALTEEGSPLSALARLLSSRAGPIEKPEELANQLAFLPIALGDPEFRGLAVEQAQCARDGIRELLAGAVEAGELGSCDTTKLAQAIHVTYTGALLTWAVLREGTVQEWVQSNLETVLRPYQLRKPAKKRKGAKR